MLSEDQFIAPVIFTMTNTGGLIKSQTLFLPSLNRNLPNNGLAPQIVMSFNYATNPNYSYTQFLADCETQPFKIWKFRYYQKAPVRVNPPLPGDMSDQLNQIIEVATLQSDGSLAFTPLQPYLDLDQTAPNAMEFRNPIILEDDIGLSFQINALHTLEFWFWLDMNVSEVNKLMTGKHEHVFSKPFPLEAHNPYLVRISYNSRGIDFME